VVTPSEIPKGSAEHSILGGRSKWDWVTPVLDVDQGKADMVKAILSERKRREGFGCPVSQKSEHRLGDDYGISHVEEGTYRKGSKRLQVDLMPTQYT